MKQVMLALGVAVLSFAGALSAAPKQGAGFTGIGSEAASVVQSGRWFQGMQVKRGALLGDIPQRAVRSSSANRLDQAELAIRHGGRSGRRAKRVTLAGQKLALSIVFVNDTPYAVLRRPSGLFQGKVGSGASAALATDTRALTGCAADSRVYAYGPADRAEGVAVALYCG